MHVSVDHKAKIAWVIGHEHPIASFAFEEWGGASGASVAAQNYMNSDGEDWTPDMTEPARHKDTTRNGILNRTLSDLERIINHHDPEIDVPISDGVWDRLDKMALEIEAHSATS